MKTQYGYHIVQVEESAAGAHTALSEVLPTHPGHADSRRSRPRRRRTMRAQLTSEAIKNGLEKTAAAHHLQLVTTPPVAAAGRDFGAA